MNKVGNTLTVEGKNSSSVTFSINYSNNSNITNTWGFNSWISNIGGNIMQFNNNNCNIGTQGEGSIVTINGKRVDLNRLDEISVDEKEETAITDNIYSLDDSCIIKSVSIKGSGTLNPIPNKFISDVFSSSISGSGNIYLHSKHFKILNINIAGSGDVDGNNETCTDTVNINVAGSGDVSGIHVNTSGIASIAGSGDIRITSDNPSSILKNKMGSGRIKIRRK